MTTTPTQAVERLREALERCAVIVERNLGRQNEKVEDVVHIARAALSSIHVSEPSGEGERTFDDYAYGELWGAIAAATRVEGGIVAISVVKFREAIRALTTVEVKGAPLSQGVPAGMKAYGPDHPDYPSRPQDCLMGEDGRVQWFDGAITHGPVDMLDWEHRTSDHPRSRDIIAYTPRATGASGEVERLTMVVAKVFSGMPERMADVPVRAGEHHIGTLWSVSQEIAAQVLAALSSDEQGEGL